MCFIGQNAIGTTGKTNRDDSPRITMVDALHPDAKAKVLFLKNGAILIR